MTNETLQFDSTRACIDTTYLLAQERAASKFAAAHMELNDARFIEALTIKKALEEEVDVSILKEGLMRAGIVRLSVAQYLSVVSVMGIGNDVIEAINDELKGEKLNTEVIYWLIVVLKGADTAKKDQYLEWLKNNESLKAYPLIAQLLK